MTKKISITMGITQMCKPALAAVQAVFLCLLLSGCVGAGISRPTLKAGSATPADTRLLQPVVYVLHDTLDQSAWVEALSTFTNKENIFIFAETRGQEPDAKAPDYYSKGLPVVHISFEVLPRQETAEDKVSTVSTILSLMTFSVIPGWMVNPNEFRASFRLSRSGDEDASGPQWVYSYKRKMFLWLPLLPVADEFIFFGDFSLKNWNAEEKRRLILVFLEDAKLILQKTPMAKTR